MIQILRDLKTSSLGVLLWQNKTSKDITPEPPEIVHVLNFQLNSFINSSFIISGFKIIQIWRRTLNYRMSIFLEKIVEYEDIRSRSLFPPQVMCYKKQSITSRDDTFHRADTSDANSVTVSCLKHQHFNGTKQKKKKNVTEASTEPPWPKNTRLENIL